MAASTIITEYIGRGAIADRPVTPSVPAGCSALYLATDVGVSGTLYAWNGAAWVADVFSGFEFQNMGVPLAGGPFAVLNFNTANASVSDAGGGVADLSIVAVDGDRGDIVISGSGTVWTIDTNVVTYAKMQDISATKRVLGRNTASAGDTEEVTATQVLDWLGSAARGDVLYRGAASWTLLPAGTSGFYLKTLGSGADPAWAAVPTISDGDKGDIVVSSSGAVFTIDAHVVDYGKMQQVSVGTALLGRGIAGAGDITELQAAADNTVMRRTGGILTFGLLTAGMFDANIIPDAAVAVNTFSLSKLVNAAARYNLIGRSSASAGAWEQVTTSADVFAMLGSANNAAILASIGAGSYSLANNTIAAARLAASASPRLFGRTTASAGGGEEISVAAELSLASLTLGVAANGITNALFRQGAAVSVVGVTGGATSNVADITASADGQVLRRSSSSALAFGTLLATSFADNTIVAARLSATATNKLFGRASASGGAGEEIGLAADLAFSAGNLQVGAFTGDITKTAGSLATSIGANKVVTAMILDANVTLAKIVNASARYVLLGRSSSGAGVFQEVATSADVFAMLGSANNAAILASIGAGTYSLADNTIVAARLAATAQYRLFGRSSASAGAGQEITSSADMFTLIGSANYAAARANLSLSSGDNVTFNSITTGNGLGLFVKGTSGTARQGMIIDSSNDITFGDVSELSHMYFKTNGNTRLTLFAGVIVGNATGGDKGADTLNSSGYYLNGTIAVDSNNLLRAKPFTVSTLPSASGIAGARANVSDAFAAPVFNATATGSGSTAAPVWSDGTNWKYG